MLVTIMLLECVNWTECRAAACTSAQRRHGSPPKPRVYRDPYHSQYKLGEYDSIFYIQHHHFIRDDGVNFGFFMDGIHSEDDRLDEYARMSIKFKAKYIEEARDMVKNDFTEKVTI